MPFVVHPEPGEELYVLRELRSVHGHVFGMAVSNQAIYLPAQKFVVKGDPWHFRRVPLSEVIEVRFEKQKTAALYLLSVLMILFGLIMSYLMMAPILRGEESDVSGWPIAILVGGIVVPFIARGRKTLIVKMTKGKYTWKPQISVDQASRDQHAEIQASIIAGCRKAGIHTVEIA